MGKATAIDLRHDALQELINIGGGHAATALAKVLKGRRIDLELATVERTTLAQLSQRWGSASSRLFVCEFVIEGGVTGALWWLLPQGHAEVLASLLLGEPQHSPLSPRALGALTEVSNIVASACLSAIGTVAQLRLLPSPPDIAEAHAGALAQANVKTVTVLESCFFSRSEPAFSGRLLVLLDERNVDALCSPLKL